MNEISNQLEELKLTDSYEEKLVALKEEMSVSDKYLQQDNSDLTEMEDFWMTILHVCRRNMNVSLIYAISREKEDYNKRSLFYLRTIFESTFRKTECRVFGDFLAMGETTCYNETRQKRMTLR